MRIFDETDVSLRLLCCDRNAVLIFLSEEGCALVEDEDAAINNAEQSGEVWRFRNTAI